MLRNTSLRNLLLAFVALAIGFLAVATTVALIGQHSKWKSAAETGHFVEVILSASRFVHETQRERGQSAGFLANANSLEQLQQQRAKTDSALLQFQDQVNGWQGIGAEQFSQIIRDLKNLSDLRTRVNARSVTGAEAAAAYTTFIAASTNAMAVSGSQQAAASYDEQLIILIGTYVDLEWAKEYHGRERAQTNAIIGLKSITPQQRDLLVSTRALASNALSQVRTKSPSVAEEVQQRTAQTAQILQRYREQVLKEDFGTLTAADWWAQITSYIDGLRSVLENEGKTIRETSTNHAAYARNQFLATLLGGLIGVLLFGILGWIVSHRLNMALGSIQNTITEVERSGDFGKRVHYPYKDEVGQTALAFNKLLLSFSSIIQEVQKSCDAIASASNTMARSGADVRESSSAQSEAAAAVAAAMEQTSVSMSETSTNALEADAVVARARGKINDTLATMAITVRNVENVANLIDVAGKNVRQLDEGSKKIGGIVQVIKDIADQTNLLALNAAIEAARAGDQGRGFAVVADEVRKLAERTTSATEEIASLIGGIQSEIDSTVSEMLQADSQTKNSLSLVAQSENALRSAGEDSVSAADNVRGIVDAVREQDAAVHQVADSIERIAQMTERNSASAKAAGETALYLEQMANELKSTVSRFKT